MIPVALRKPRPSPLARHGEVALFRQIYEHFRRAIAAGQLAPGDRLPSCRRLAEQFATARGTVDAAYAMLAGEGYVVSRGSAGTIVSPDLAAPSFVRVASRPRASKGVETIEAGEPRPFQMGLPALDAFPRKLWAHLVGREARRFSSTEMVYPDPAGSKLLRQAIVGYLATSRGINCTWRQVLITHGYRGGLDLTTSVLLRPRDQVWIEDPLLSAGARRLAFHRRDARAGSCRRGRNARFGGPCVGAAGAACGRHAIASVSAGRCAVLVPAAGAAGMGQ